MINCSLSIKINNKNPLELNKLTSSLNAIGRQYNSFIRKNKSFQYSKTERILYVNKIESGCVFIDLIPCVVPLIENMNSIISFVEYLKTSYDYFKGNAEKPQYDYSKNDCIDFKESLEQIASDNGSNMQVNLEGCTINQNFNISYTDANAIQNIINKKLEEKEVITDFYDVAFRWEQVNKNDKSKSVDKGIIDCITDIPVKTIVEDENIKKSMVSQNQDNPFKKVYLVDVKVAYIKDNIPSFYKILSLKGETEI